MTIRGEEKVKGERVVVISTKITNKKNKTQIEREAKMATTTTKTKKKKTLNDSVCGSSPYVVETFDGQHVYTIDPDT